MVDGSLGVQGQPGLYREPQASQLRIHRLLSGEEKLSSQSCRTVTTFSPMYVAEPGLFCVRPNFALFIIPSRTSSSARLMW